MVTEALPDTLTKSAADKSVENGIEGNSDNLKDDLESLAEANAAGHEISGASDFMRKEYAFLEPKSRLKDCLQYEKLRL
ncbi:MAG: hypothetical protein ACI9RU_002076 [Litorivivens sp.]